GVERPTEMLTRMAKSNANAVMAQHLFIERRNQRELITERWRRFAYSSRKEARDLAGKPRPALRAPPDHDSIRTGGSQRAEGVVECRDVAIDDDRKSDTALDRRYGGPVRL